MTRITRHFAASHGHGRLFVLWSLVVLYALGLLAFGGCASSEGPKPVVTEVQSFTPEEQAAWEAAKAAEYRVRVRDKLSVRFKYHTEMNLDNVLILPDGRITMPEIDSVVVSGLTVSQIDSTLTEFFGREYLDPDLSVLLSEFGTIGVYVLGEVNKPGYHQLSAETTSLIHAIAIAGGFHEDAATSEVLLMRVTPAGFVYRHMDLSHLEQRAFMSPELLDIQPYDVIYVPRSAIGDLTYFKRTILSTVLSVSDLFWDIYAVMNLEKVTIMGQ